MPTTTATDKNAKNRVSTLVSFGDGAEAEIANMVEGLIAQEKLREAAALCQASGRTERAIDLLERAAAFDEAARLALDHGMPARALRLAAPFGSEAILAEAAAKLDPEEAAKLAPDLAARGLHRAAAQAFRAAQRPLDEAACWERASDPLKAAQAFRRGNDPLNAARALTARVTEQPGDSKAALELGRLLLEHGKNEAAARSLQGVDAGTPEGREARALLATALDRLGLHEARASLGEVDEADVAPASSRRALLYGRYEVLRSVATTPTARVLECVDRLGGQRVAVKVLRPGSGGEEGRDAIARFSREARALGLLRHPSVVPLLAFHAEGPAVVLAWMEGGSLADLLTRGPISPDRAVEIARSVLAALAEAHRIGVLHRDIKPSNILLDGAGAPYVADFGAAHVSDAAATVTAGLIGSLAYMAPEQLAGQPATMASDVYGIGAVLYEAITGAEPRPADELALWPSNVYPDLDNRHDQILRSMLARMPGERPATALEARDALGGRSFRVLRPGVTRVKAVPAPRASGTRRLEPLEGDVYFDTALGRRVLVIEASAAALRLARACGACESRVLPAIYRLEGARQRLWVDEVEGRSLTVLGRGLRPAEARALGEALAELHKAGAAHGAVDREHVRVSAQGLRLAFPQIASEAATAAGDIAALAGLVNP